MKEKTHVNKLSILIKGNIVYIIGIVLLLYKECLLNRMLHIDIRLKVILVSSLIPMLILLPCVNRTTKKTIIYANIVCFLATILIYCNYVYYKFSTNFLSVYQISNVQYGNEIIIALPLLITFKSIVIFFLDNLVCLIASVYFIKNMKETNILSKRNKWLRITLFIVLVILNITVYTQHIQDKYKEFIYNRTSMVENISLYYYHIADIKEFIQEKIYKEKVDFEVLEEEYGVSKKNKTVNTIYTGIASNSNIIIVQLESMHEFVINKKINGKEITPNLNKFYNDNIYFTNMYNQGLGSTADSEHTIATSMYPLENGQVFQKYFKNNWNDIYSILKENGYYTSAMHPNVNTFWNRFEVYNNSYKVDEYNDIYQFNSNMEMAGEFFSDEQFLLQAVDKIKLYEQPYCTMLICVSGHIPYSLEGITDLENKITIDTSNLEDENFANYLKSMNFVDYSFGKFYEKLQENNMLDNTILVVYGDHGAGLAYSQGAIDLFAENNIPYTYSDQVVENVHVPFGMKIPNVDSFVVQNAVAKIDVKPTLLNLLGIEDKFSLGQDMFSGKDYAFIKGIGFATKDYYYINENLINRISNEEETITDEIDDMLYKMECEMHLSDIIIKNNLVTNFEK